eukprot:EG_transcript_4128
MASAASATAESHAAATRIRAAWLASCQRAHWQRHWAEWERDRAAAVIQRSVRFLQAKRVEAVGDFFAVCKVFRAQVSEVVLVQAFLRALYSQQLREILHGLRAKGRVLEACQKMQPLPKSASITPSVDHSERCHMAVLRYKMEELPRRNEATGPQMHFKSSAASGKHAQRNAAIKIQALWRTALVRRQLRPLREAQAREHAASRIQRAVRFLQAARVTAVGRLLLTRMPSRKKGGGATGSPTVAWMDTPTDASNSVPLGYEKRRDGAAVRIQSAWRRCRATATYRAALSTKHWQSAASTLQWSYRWLQGCRMRAVGQHFCLLYQQKRHRENVASPAPGAAPSVTPKPAQLSLRAARRIQTVWRGFHARRRLQPTMANIQRHRFTSVLQAAYRFLQAVRMQKIGQHFCGLCTRDPSQPRPPKGGRPPSARAQPARPAWGPVPAVTPDSAPPRPSPLADGVKFDPFAQPGTPLELRQSPPSRPMSGSARIDDLVAMLPELTKKPKPRPWKPKYFDFERHKRLEQEVRHLEEELAKFRFREQLRLQTAGRITPRQMVRGEVAKPGEASKDPKATKGPNGAARINMMKRLDDITGPRKSMEPTGLTPITRSPRLPVGDPLITGRVSQALSDTLLQLLPDADAAQPRAASEGPLRAFSGSGTRGSPSARGSPPALTPELLGSTELAFKGSPVNRSPMSLSPLAPSDLGVVSPNSGNVPPKRRSETYERRLPSLDAAQEFGPLLNNVHVRTGGPASPEVRRSSR